MGYAYIHSWVYLILSYLSRLVPFHPSKYRTIQSLSPSLYRLPPSQVVIPLYQFAPTIIHQHIQQQPNNDQAHR